jgi:hypothetical protein
VNSNSRPEDPGPALHERYCRELESYLCRKNDGHLIRIVGPAFEQVCGWADRGVPLTLAMRGIDRYVERYYAKGPRRRPVRIEFCESDVLDVFDEWKRSVGVSTASGEESADTSRSSLPAHLDRVIARLTVLRSGSNHTLGALLEDLVRELDAARAKAKTVRGDARDAMIARLGELDATLLDAWRQQTDADTLRQCERQADEELKPFRSRLREDAYRASHRACINRLLRDRGGLPTITYE